MSSSSNLAEVSSARRNRLQLISLRLFGRCCASLCACPRPQNRPSADIHSTHEPPPIPSAPTDRLRPFTASRRTPSWVWAAPWVGAGMRCRRPPCRPRRPRRPGCPSTQPSWSARPRLRARGGVDRSKHHGCFFLYCHKTDSALYTQRGMSITFSRVASLSRADGVRGEEVRRPPPVALHLLREAMDEGADRERERSRRFSKNCTPFCRHYSIYAVTPHAPARWAAGPVLP